MARKSSQVELKVIHTSTAPDRPETPRPLGKHGLRLWRAVTEVYSFDDPGSSETLLLCCQALDRAESCREQIDREGQMIASGNVKRSHPLLRDELANRALLGRLLFRLGLDLEPVRQTRGRPPSYRI